MAEVMTAEVTSNFSDGVFPGMPVPQGSMPIMPDELYTIAQDLPLELGPNGTGTFTVTYTVPYTITEDRPWVTYNNRVVFKNADGAEVYAYHYPVTIMPPSIVEGTNLACDPTAMPAGATITCQVIEQTPEGMVVKSMDEFAKAQGVNMTAGQWEVGSVSKLELVHPKSTSLSKPADGRLPVIVTLWDKNDPNGNSLRLSGDTDNSGLPVNTMQVRQFFPRVTR
jgi:hypothetical protein